MPVQRSQRVCGLCGGGFLPGGQPLQQGGHCIRRHLRRKCPQCFCLRVCGIIRDARKHCVQLCIQGGASGCEGRVFLGQRLLQFLVALGAEQLPEDLAPLLSGGVEQPGELPLRDHGDLGKLVVVQPDDINDSGSHLLGFGHRRAAVGIGQGGIRLFSGESLAPGLGAQILRVAPDGVPLPPHLKFQLHKGGCAGVCIFAAEHGPIPHAAAGMIVQGVGDGIEQGGLARAGVAGDKVEPAFAQLLQRQGGGACIGAKGREGQLERSHASSSFQMLSMSCWQNAACSWVRGWLFCSW